MRKTVALSKNPLDYSLILFSFFVITIFISCKKNILLKESSEVLKNNKAMMARPGGGGGGGGGQADYCKSCGGSNTPGYFCMPDGYDPFTRETFYICVLDPLQWVCPETTMNRFAVSFGIGDSVNSILSYMTRDSLLAQNSLGQDYITFAYYIGWVMNNHHTITTQNILSHITFANKTNNIAQILLYGETTEVVITEAYARLANEMLDYYLAVNVNPHFNAILQRIKGDINQFKGLTKLQLLAAISS